MLLIFDCDGVLVDSEILSNTADIELLAELGIHFELGDYMRHFVGKSMRDVIRGLEAHSGQTLPADFAQRKAQKVQEAFTQSLQAMPGIAELLQSLPQPKCVASGSNPARLQLSLSLTGLIDFFSPNIFSATMVERGKPAPDLFLYAAQQMGANPADCVVLEDSLSGIQAAVAAGMYPVGFVGGSHAAPDLAERLKEAGAKQVIAHLSGFAQILEGLA